MWSSAKAKAKAPSAPPVDLLDMGEKSSAATVKPAEASPGCFGDSVNGSTWLGGEIDSYSNDSYFLFHLA